MHMPLWLPVASKLPPLQIKPFSHLLNQYFLSVSTGVKPGVHLHVQIYHGDIFPLCYQFPSVNSHIHVLDFSQKIKTKPQIHPSG